MIGVLISRLLTLLVGIIYPAYGSYRALKLARYDETKQWLVYWVVFAAFTICEGFTDVLISWLPLYRELKFLLVLWLVSPGTDGSSLLYGELISPVLENNEGKLLEMIMNSRDQLYKVFGHVFNWTCNRLKGLYSEYSGMVVTLKI